MTLDRVEIEKAIRTILETSIDSAGACLAILNAPFRPSGACITQWPNVFFHPDRSCELLGFGFKHDGEHYQFIGIKVKPQKP